MLVLVGAMLVALIGLSSVFSRVILLHSFAELEQERVDRNVWRTVYALNRDLKALDVVNADWAHWDYSYQFVQDGNQQFIDTNLPGETFALLTLNVIAFVNTAGEPVYAQGYDLQAGEEVPLPEGIAQQLIGNPALARLDGPADHVNGIVLLPGGPMLVAARAILPSDGQGPSRGALIFGRYLTQIQIDELAEATYMALDIRRIDDPALPDEYVRARARLAGFAASLQMPGQDHRIVQVTHSDTLAGYTVLADINGDPALLMRVDVPRSMYAQGQDTIVFFMLALAAGGLVLVGMALFVIERLVVVRLLKLNAAVRRIGQTGDVSIRVPVSGGDEVTNLATGLNSMLANLESSQRSLRENQQRIQQIITSISDAIYSGDLAPDGTIRRFSILSPQFAILTGYPLDRFQEDWHFWQTLVHPDDWPAAQRQLETMQAGHDSEIEYRVFRADGVVVWVRDSVHVVPQVAGTGDGFTVYGVISNITERKQAEQALRERETRYRTLFEKAHDAILTLHDDTFIDCNPRALEMFGCTREQIVGQPPHRFSPETQPDGQNSREKIYEKIRLAMDDIPQTFDWRHIRIDGTPFDAEISLACMVLSGEVLVQAIIHDITERKRAEVALADERNLLRTIIDHVPATIYVKDLDGAILLANMADVHIRGAARQQDVIGKTDRDFYTPEFARQYETDDARVIASGEMLVAREELVSGRWLLTTKVPLRDSQGTITGLVGIGYDITERRHAEEALRESEERLELALQGAGLGSWDWDVPTNRVVSNARWSEMLGYVPGQIASDYATWRGLLHPDDRQRVSQTLDAHLAGRTPFFESEYRLQSQSGAWVWVLDRGKVVRRGPDGEPQRVAGTHLDITERKQAEAERERLLQQTETRAAELATVAEVSRQATTILDVDQLLWTVSGLIKENFDLYHVHIYLLDAGGEQLDLVAGAGVVGRQLVAEKISIPITYTKSLVARAARSRAAIVVNDVTQVDDFLGNPLLPDTRSEVAIPMIVGERLVGVLNVEDDVVGRFTDEDVSVQSTLAAQVAIAIHNAQLFTDSARRLAIIENSDSLVALSDYTAPTMTPAYINPAGLRLLGYDSMQAVRGRPLSSFYTPEALRLLRREVLPAVLRHGSWRGENVLRRADDSLVPVEQTVFVIHDDQGQPRDLATIVNDITERRQAEDALRRANRAYRALSDCNQAMVRAVDEPSLLDEICQIVVEAGSYRMAWVCFVEGDDLQTLRPVASAGHVAGYLDTIFDGDRNGIAQGPTAAAIRAGQPYIVHDIAADPVYDCWRDEALSRAYHSMVALPLIDEGRVLGALNVYGIDSYAFDTEEIALLVELANDLAYGIGALRTRVERRMADDQLRRSETNLLALIENTDELIFSVDHDLKLIVANSRFRDALEAAFGVSLPSGVLSSDMLALDALPDAMRADWVNLYAQAFEGERFTVERRYNLPGLPPGDMEIAFNPIRSETGEISGVSVFVTDVSQRKRDEEALHQLNDRLEKRNRELLALHELGQTLTGTLDVHEIYRLMYDEIAQRLLATPNFVVALYDEVAGLITCDFAVVDGVETDIALFPPMPLGSGPNSQTIRTRQPHIIDLPEDVPAGTFVQVGDERAPRSLLYVPLISGNQVIGVFGVQHYEPDAFKNLDLALMSTLANQAASALQNARLFAAEREQRLLAEALSDTASAINRTLDLDRLVERIQENLQRVIPHTTANLMLLDDGYVRVVGHHGYAERGLESWIASLHFPVEQLPNLQHILATGQPLVISDTRTVPGWARTEQTQWVMSYASAPMLREGRVFGFLNVYGETPGFFTEKHAERLQAFADQAAIAIQNARLFADEREQRTFAEALREIAAVINVTLDPEDVFESILQNIKRVVPHDAANIMLIEGQRARVVRGIGYVERGLGEWIRGLSFSVEENSLLREVVATDQPVVVGDTAHAPGWQDLPETDWLHAYACAPIRYADRVIGFLNVYSETPDFYRPFHAERLQAFAHQAANAIRNAQLFAAEHNQRAMAEALRDTAAAINRTLDPETVLDRILENTKRVIPHDAANIMFIEGGTARVVRSMGYEQFDPATPINNLRVAMSDMPHWQDMIETGQPFAMPDTAADPRWRLHVDSHDFMETWIRSTVKAPIRIEGKGIGILHLDSATPGAFSSADAEKLQAFADQAAVAIQNAQLFAAERDQRALAEALHNTAAAINRTLEFDEVLDHILTNVGHVVPSDTACIMFIDEADDHAYVVADWNFDAHGMGGAWRDAVRLSMTDTGNLRRASTVAHPLIIPDTAHDPEWVIMPETAWIRSHATVPILREGEVLGFLMLDSATPGFFGQQHVEPLRAFADHAAVAIQNARLFTAERNQRALAEALRDTAAAINRTLNFDEVLDLILDNTGRVVPHDAANVMLIEDGVARVVRGHGYEERGAGPWVRDLRFTVSEVPIWRQMFETGQPFAVPDTQLDPLWLNLPDETWIRSTVKAPIRVQGRIIGIVHLDSTTPGAFSQVHADRLQAFADQAAVALRNAQFFAAERDQRTLAEALRDTAAAVNSTLDFDTVLDRILTNVGRVAPYDVANIMLLEGDEARVVRRYPLPDESEPAPEGVRVTINDIPNLRRMVETGQPIVIPDTAKYPDWVEIAGLTWIRAHVAAPIRRDEQVIGFVMLDAHTPDFFTQAHADRLQVFADQVSVAIYNAQLFEAVQRHAAELEQRVRERTVELEQRRAQLQAILDSIGEGVIYDEKLETKYINHALTVLTGYEPAEYTGYLTLLRSSQYTLAEFSALQQHIFDMVSDRGIWRGELRLRHQEGKEFDAALTVTQVRNSAQEIIGAVTVIRDISQEKALQEQKDRFIASASHELRTPLANVKTRLYLLRKQPEKAEQHLQILDRVTSNMAELIENLLDVSRFERGVIPLYRRVIALQDTIRDVVNIQQAEADRKKITLRADLPAEALRVFVDPQRMAQVVTNIVSNAINYTPEGGQIVVELAQEGPRVVMRVRDTGIGIEEAMLSQVFEPFFRANEEKATGTGLGLTIAREIVRLHGGEIAVDSEVGRGSIFTVVLDLHRE